MPVYKGSSKLGLISKEGFVITHVYKGSQLVYRLSFDPVTFTSSGTWTVPAGIKQIRVDCVAAAGIVAGGDRIDQRPGYGGRVQTVLRVEPGQILYITVGVLPTNWTVSSYNASDIRIGNNDYASRVIVAGGGGSGIHTSHRNHGGSGGHGGGLIGANGTCGNGGLGVGGAGGTQTAGGAGGWGFNATGGAGTFGLGGSNTASWTGGAGGAGWYGGGAGGNGAHDSVWARGGGGGGSSYTHPDLCSEVVHTQGYQTGNGYITVSMV